MKLDMNTITSSTPYSDKQPALAILEIYVPKKTKPNQSHFTVVLAPWHSAALWTLIRYWIFLITQTQEKQPPPHHKCILIFLISHASSWVSFETLILLTCLKTFQSCSANTISHFSVYPENLRVGTQSVVGLDCS